MARIRNIKPAFFRHEALQDLEAAHPGQYPMLVYIGLWTQCDAAGIFPWRPRQLKLDILPFLDFKIEITLDLLAGAGFIHPYDAEGEKYGMVLTFSEHQRITGKEASEGEKHPKPFPAEPGNNRETTGKQPVAQERSTGKEIGNQGGSNARAHEAENFSKKTDPPAATPLPPEKNFDEVPLGDFARLYQVVRDWGESDTGHAEIVAWKKITGYRDSQHGPTTDEVAKFVSYHIGAKSTPENKTRFKNDPLAFFRAQFPGWLTNAKTWNRPPRGHPDRAGNAREYNGHQRRGNNSVTPTHISTLITPPST